jgi:hypothetical protein
MRYLGALLCFNILIVGLSNAQPGKDLPFTPASFSVWSQRMDLSAYTGKNYRLKVAIRALPAGMPAGN